MLIFSFYLGAPARYASPAGLSATTPQALAMGLMVADSSFRPVALPLPVPQSPRLYGVFATIPWRRLKEID